MQRVSEILFVHLHSERLAAGLDCVLLLARFDKGVVLQGHFARECLPIVGR